MTRIKQAGPAVLIVSVIAGLIGYLIGCTREQRDKDDQAGAQAAATESGKERAGEPPAVTSASSGETANSATTAPVKRDVYNPGSEALAPDERHARFNVSTHVLPGQLSMTLLYITDAKSDKLHIYRAFGGMDTSFKGDPKLYRTFDLTSVGEKSLRQAK